MLRLLRTKPLLLLFAVFLCGINYAQESDTSLILQRFDKDDIIEFSPQKDQLVYAAGRIMEDQRDIPRVIYVITKEQIALEGYSTLVDILKDIPGFRVSQPGSAQLGETFINRGMVGNIYTKILINGLPVNPSGAPGMPIGSQLPIKQAQRIEIIADPSSTLYGSDAMAGVINIVLPEISRPVQVTSDVRLGTNGLTEISTSIGGKVGRDKNVFSYNLYGTSKSVNDYNIESSQFTVDSVAQNSPYYLGESDNPSQPEIVGIPHHSSIVGLNMNFRGFRVSWNLLYRQDHSALGAHPSKISYSDPGNFYGENITNGAIQYSKNLGEHWSLLMNASTVIYAMDNNSSYVGIGHDLSNGVNYMYASSADFRFEPLVRYNRDRFTVLSGALFANSSGINSQNFLLRPFIEEEKLTKDSMGNYVVSNSLVEGDIIDSSFVLDKFNFNTISLFSQVFYKGDRLNVMAGFRYERRTDLESFIPVDTTGNFDIKTIQATPSIGVLYALTDQITFRGSFTRAFQTPGPYYQSNNYGASMLGQPLNRRTVLHGQEVLGTFSAGADYYLQEKKGRIALSYFRNKLKSSLYTEIKVPIGEIVPPGGFYVGHVNRNTESILNGTRLSFYRDFPNISMDIHGAYYFGYEELEDVAELDGYRSVPNYEVKANVKARFWRKNAVGLNVQFYGPFVNRIIVAKGQVFEDVTGASYNVDLFYSRKFGKNLTGSFKVMNLTNTVTKGVFTNWLDGYDFNYVPQLQRWFYVNLSYDLN